MRTFRLGEDIPLEAKSVTTTLNQVQVQVEEYFSPSAALFVAGEVAGRPVGDECPRIIIVCVLLIFCTIYAIV